MKITPTVATAECPCEGRRRWTWHANRELPQCAASKLGKKQARLTIHKSAPKWTPGTSIYEPDLDMD